MAIQWNEPKEDKKGNGISWEAGALSQSQSAVDRIRQAQQAEQQAQQAASPMGIAGQTALGTGKTLLGMGKDFVNSTLKGVGSAIKAPVDLAKQAFGGMPDEQANIPGIGGMQKSIQGEFSSKTIPQVMSGQQTPLGATAGAVGQTVGAAANVVGGAQLVGGLAKKGVFSGAGKAITDYLAKRADKKALEGSISAITPKLTSGEMEALSKTHNVVKPTFGAPKIDFSSDKGFTDVAQNVKGLVKGKSAIEDVGKVKGALGKEAEMLKSQVAAADHPYTFRELQSRLSNVEEPISLRGTPFEKQIKPIKEAAIKIAQEKGGNVSGLFDARKEFDNLVEKTYPNLYESENAPMRNAITAIRNEMNNFIDENLPVGSGFKESLKKQRMFYDAIDKIATKIPDEIKKGSMLKRLLNSTPFKVGAGVVGGSAVAGAGKNLVGE